MQQFSLLLSPLSHFEECLQPDSKHRNAVQRRHICARGKSHSEERTRIMHVGPENKVALTKEYDNS